jgi:hypothetical protein
MEKKAAEALEKRKADKAARQSALADLDAEAMRADAHRAQVCVCVCVGGGGHKSHGATLQCARVRFWGCGGVGAAELWGGLVGGVGV